MPRHASSRNITEELDINKELKKFHLAKKDYMEFFMLLRNKNFSEKQINRIFLKNNNKRIVTYLTKNIDSLTCTASPCHRHAKCVDLDRNHIVNIAHVNGANIFEDLKNYYNEKENVFTKEETVRMTSCKGGSKNWIAAINYYNELIARKFTKEEIIKIADCNGGSLNLETVVEHYNKLEELGFTNQDIIEMACCNSGSRNLNGVINNYNGLIEKKFTKEQIIQIFSSHKGMIISRAINDNYDLFRQRDFSIEEMIKVTSHNESRENIKELAKTQSFLKDLTLSKKNFMKIISINNGFALFLKLIELKDILTEENREKLIDFIFQRNKEETDFLLGKMKELAYQLCVQSTCFQSMMNIDFFNKVDDEEVSFLTSAGFSAHKEQEKPSNENEPPFKKQRTELAYPINRNPALLFSSSRPIQLPPFLSQPSFLPDPPLSIQKTVGATVRRL